MDQEPSKLKVAGSIPAAPVTQFILPLRASWPAEKRRHSAGEGYENPHRRRV